MKNAKPAAHAPHSTTAARADQTAAAAEAHAHPHAHPHDHAHAHAPRHPHGESPEAALALAEEYCRERGEKLTPIRRKVLELLLNSGRATKAYSLLDEMRQIHPGSAPPTVYRALDFLLSAGLVHRIESINAFTVCHDLTQCQHGILVVCQQCGNVTELHQPKLRQALIAQIEDAGYRVASDEIELKGVCSACQAAEVAAAAASKVGVTAPGAVK
ncbi:transcriptional repressor [bacterium M00.F.Ca.ET.228.01.1.1]|uniref:Fur family transcriptional regulator n=1 Tax=Paraburkholderia phenoliruptrix TaxID=252970 RepID=UPI00109284DD|nr:Fur family transcriptional regulator [Paraburkholderia phenoliruptrix]TGP40687.1 transcriptional repressor [bacterium M00.F.Ca.ET.228.01.1.1]TGR96938.1 transcriptional repressor [bacterium M00.F.Ca.ET.191.01.1.1]TGT98248.1 transcriptional repressor [bacterium M00.F.Ca.ET.155.01.1.1]MBW0448184.1 transcriptional repressor [Paraburkholderia phenoliruptrix]MBW9100291.1 transcriptional repressor [Paraburkholderia phenoliruptrix]